MSIAPFTQTHFRLFFLNLVRTADDPPHPLDADFTWCQICIRSTCSFLHTVVKWTQRVDFLLENCDPMSVFV